jgi:4-hydroxybutyrate dehydrogenase
MALIQYLTRIQFDYGALDTLAAELALIGAKRPLIVTDKGVVAAGLLAQVLAKLGLEPAGIFDGTPANPTEEAALAAIAQFKAVKADSCIGLGGGSSMDLAKVVALGATHEGPLVRYAAIEGGVPRIGAHIAPSIAIPTTAGTGSEVGRGAILVFADGRKLGIVSPFLIPRVAVCDPELTLGLPRGLTAATGMDALAHCIETFLAPAINPPAEAIALDGAVRVVKHIERATKDGQDREARWHMMMGAMQGAMAFQKGLGAVHALSHPLGSLKDLNLHHGTLNAVVMPAVLRFNESATGDKYARLRVALGLAADTKLDAFVADLNARLGIAPGLKAMGVEPSRFAGLIPHILADHTAATNPRKLDATAARMLLEESL